jgi:alkylation response protein AidB-like acyl-CoA dehydrogenase
MASTSQANEMEALPAAAQQLCQQLRDAASELDKQSNWPARQMQWCADAGVFRWFIPEQYGGWGWSEQQILSGYLALSASCLTTTFVLTQWNAACRRILGSDNDALKRLLLPKMAQGELFATVGISHLTTSRQHVARPVLRADLTSDGGLLLNGYSPWVTAAAAADVIVIGATLDDGRQVMCALPTTRTGVHPQPGQSLVALSASCTDQVELDGVQVAAEEILAGPIENVMQVNSGGGAGGLQTSTLADGLATAAVEFIREQASRRSELEPISAKLLADTQQLRQALVELTAGNDVMSPADLRGRANSLVLRATQAALSAAKGAGFIASHPTGRWAREALFFLVWSCPQPVVTANLCELAQLT